MIDINELRQSLGALQPEEVAELLDRLEEAESDALEQARLNGMGASREAALMAKLEAAEKERYAESIAMYRKARDERDALRAKVSDLMINVAFLDNLKKSYEELIEELQNECDRLRAKIEAMEKQEPFGANSDVFRGAFEAALKAGYWPAARQEDGYHSPTTQIAWLLASSTIDRLKLYPAPGAKGE